MYDAVVLDAPPTGRIATFLNVNHEVSGLAKAGPIRNHADGVMAVIGSALTAVHIVTLLEAMPVQETIDGAGELRAAGLPVGAVVVNMVRDPVLPIGTLDRLRDADVPLSELTDDLAAAGLLAPGGPVGEQEARELLSEGGSHATRVALERVERANLDVLDRPVIELPWLASGVDVGALYELAESLAVLTGVRSDAA